MFVAPHLSNELRSVDYNKIKYISFMAVNFNDDIIFELSPIRLPIGHFGQMQSMNCKYDGNVWCKVKTSNINNNFGLGFRNTKCLGHLHCDNDSCKHFFHFAVQNEVCWIGDFAQIPLISQFALKPFVSIIVCRFYVVSPFYVNIFPYRMHYVIHKLQSLSKVMIHLSTHVHPIAEGMCKEALEEIKVLVEGQVSRTLDTKFSAITLNFSKAFLAHHLFNENGEGHVEILQGEKLDKVMDKFQLLYSPNIRKPCCIL
jgi:hypothetical protein